MAAAFLSFNAATALAQPVDHKDKSFIEAALKAGAEEVDISRVAADRTAVPEVRSFAQMLVDDHTGANEKLAAIAMSKDVRVPAKDMSETNKWSKKSAKDFDHDYIDKMVSAHKDAVELFQKEADKGEDPDTRAFARDTLPKLQHHLEMALDLKKTVK